MTVSKEEKREKYSDLSEAGLSGHIVENFPAVNDVRVSAEKFLNYCISVRCAQQLGDFSIASV